MHMYNANTPSKDLSLLADMARWSNHPKIINRTLGPRKSINWTKLWPNNSNWPTRSIWAAKILWKVGPTFWFFVLGLWVLPWEIERTSILTSALSHPRFFFSLSSSHLLTAAPLKHTSIQSGPWNQAFQVSFRILRSNGFLPCGRKEDQRDKQRTRRRSDKKKKLTAPKQRPGTRPLLKNPYERSAMAGTALMIAKTSLSSNGPSLGRWWDCNHTNTKGAHV